MSAQDVGARPLPELGPPDGAGEPSSPGGAATAVTLYLVVLLAVPSRLVVGPLGSAGAPSMLLGLLALAWWGLLLLTRKEAARRLFFLPVRWGLGALLLVSGISYALAMSRPINPDEVSPADVSLLALLSWAGVMLFTTDHLTGRRGIDAVVWRVAMAGGILAALGLVQFLFKVSVADVIRIPGLTEVSQGGVYYRNGLVRPNGTATHPIEYGAIMAMMLPIALHVAIYHVRRSPVLRWGAVLAIIAVVGVSGSRSAYVCTVAGVLVCFFVWPPLLRRWLVSLGVLGVGLVALVWPRMTRIIVSLFDNPEADPSITSRTDSFDFAWAFTAQHPWFGRGTGTFLPKYRIFDNQYLVQLVSVGTLGVTALVALAVVAMSQMRRVAREANLVGDLRVRDLAGSLSGAVLAGFVSMAFFDAFAFPMTMGTLFLLLGLVGAVARMKGQA